MKNVSFSLILFFLPFPFYHEISFMIAAERVTLYQKIKASFPDKIPIIVEKAPGADVPQIKKRKYLHHYNILKQT